MDRRVWMVLLIAAIALVVLAGPSAAKRPSACERLRGADLAPARTVRLVMRANEHRGTDLVGCALPQGRVRTFASSADQEATRRRYDVLQVAGTFVLLRSHYANQYAGANTVAVRNIRSGDSYEIAYMCAEAGGRDCGRGGRSSVALKAIVNERGQAAAALTFAGSGATTISGFSHLGERRDFDSGLPAEMPTASLKLVGDKVIWTNAGQTFDEQLPE